LLKDLTKDGYPMAIAGICPFPFTESMGCEIRDLIRNYSFSPTDDEFMIDYFMAQYFSKLAPQYVLAWGITIKVPEALGPTGGIIGNPHREAKSADGNSEYIGNGLSVAAYPGGPGIVIEGEPQVAKNILFVSNPTESGKAPLFAMAKKAMEFNVHTAIMITDGTGLDAQGCALTLDGNEIKCVTLE